MMKAIVRLGLVAAGVMASQTVLAQAPAGSTGQCKDGTYTTAATKSGACRGHQGIKDWYAAAPAAAPAAKGAAAAPAAAPAAAAKTAKAAPAAAAPAAAALGPAPAGSTGQCKDGTYTTAASKMGACRGHQGVKDWYAATAAPAAAPAPAPAAAKAATPAAAPMAKPAPVAAAPAPAPAPMTRPAPAAAPAAAAPAAAKPSAATPKGVSGTASAPAPGGGPGMVWVNLSTKVYHCPGSRYYGTTKDGKYMSEAEAKAAGARPDHNTACTK